MEMKDHVLRFHDRLVERIWGGQKLSTVLGLHLPDNAAVGEDWLIADHRTAASIVAEGPYEGLSLHQILDREGRAVLGSVARLTIHGRFPLMLKLLDANDTLSVQVHPNDAVAAALGEPDVGKTEMWHVLEAVPGSRLYCGLKPGVDAPRLRTAIERNAFDDLLVQFPVVPATSVFVPAGTVHAIGSGILLAEIQQNSDLTYRLYDWGRLQADGTPRDLHIDKGLAATTFDHGHQGPARPLTHHRDGGECEVLAACSHFAAERIRVRGGSLTRKTGGRSFYIILGKCSHVAVTAGATTRAVRPGEAVLVAGEATEYTLEGSGSVLAYYVPDLDLDIREPLRAVGCSEDAIARLGLEAG